MQINKIEMKNISYYERGSEETPCYNATVYINGKKAVEVSNDGQGGCDRQHPYPQFNNEYPNINVIRELDAYCVEKFGTEKYEWGEIEYDLEHWCQREMYTAQDRKLLKRNMKKNVMFFENKEDLSKGKYYMIKIQNNIMGLMAYIKDKYPQSIILNDMPFDKALKTFRKEIG